MTSSCPYIHISHATLRLQTFQQLFTSVLKAEYLQHRFNDSPRLTFLLPFATNRTFHRPSRREFHTSSPRPRKFVKDIQRTAKFKHDRTTKKASVGGTDGRGDQRLDGNSDGRQAWHPYSEAGLKELQSLVSDLEQISRDQTIEDEVKEVDLPFEHGSIIYTRAQSNRPYSPLERRKFDGLPPKKRVEDVQIDRRLATNVWAKMLASPSRLDRGTKARLPRDLLSGWGILENPSDQESYILPIELSDLEGLKRELRGKERLRPNEDVEEAEAAGKPLPGTPSPGTRIQISPWKLLITCMTECFTINRPRRAGDIGPPVKSTNSQSLGKTIIPIRWRINYNQTEAFAKTRERFNQVLQRSPNPDDHEVDLKDAPQLSKLKWQPDIPSRMEMILCERVLIAFEAVGKDNASGRSMHDRRVCALGVPQSGHMTLDSRGRVGVSCVSDGDVDQIQATDEGQEMDSAPPDWISGAIFLFIGEPGDFRRTVEKWHRESHTNQANELPPLASTDLIPPMITIGGKFRVPVFNINTLFGGQEQRARLKQILETNTVYDAGFWNVDRGEQKDGFPYLVLVKPQAQHASALVKELWLLWRYLGGRSGLYLDDGGE